MMKECIVPCSNKNNKTGGKEQGGRLAAKRIAGKGTAVPKAEKKKQMILSAS
jgi:hypothetical protein